MPAAAPDSKQPTPTPAKSTSSSTKFRSRIPSRTSAASSSPGPKSSVASTPVLRRSPSQPLSTPGSSSRPSAAGSSKHTVSHAAPAKRPSQSLLPPSVNSASTSSPRSRTASAPLQPNDALRSLSRKSSNLSNVSVSSSRSPSLSSSRPPSRPVTNSPSSPTLSPRAKTLSSPTKPLTVKRPVNSPQASPVMPPSTLRKPAPSGSSSALKSSMTPRTSTAATTSVTTALKSSPRPLPPASEPSVPSSLKQSSTNLAPSPASASRIQRNPVRTAPEPVKRSTTLSPAVPASAPLQATVSTPASSLPQRARSQSSSRPSPPTSKQPLSSASASSPTSISPVLESSSLPTPLPPPSKPTEPVTYKVVRVRREVAKPVPQPDASSSFSSILRPPLPPEPPASEEREEAVVMLSTALNTAFKSGSAGPQNIVGSLGKDIARDLQTRMTKSVSPLPSSPPAGAAAEPSSSSLASSTSNAGEGGKGTEKKDKNSKRSVLKRKVSQGSMLGGLLRTPSGSAGAGGSTSAAVSASSSFASSSLSPSSTLPIVSQLNTDSMSVTAPGSDSTSLSPPTSSSASPLTVSSQTPERTPTSATTAGSSSTSVTPIYETYRRPADFLADFGVASNSSSRKTTAPTTPSGTIDFPSSSSRVRADSHATSASAMSTSSSAADVPALRQHLNSNESVSVSSFSLLGGGNHKSREGISSSSAAPQDGMHIKSPPSDNTPNPDDVSKRGDGGSGFQTIQKLVAELSAQDASPSDKTIRRRDDRGSSMTEEELYKNSAGKSSSSLPSTSSSAPRIGTSQSMGSSRQALGPAKRSLENHHAGTFGYASSSSPPPYHGILDSATRSNDPPAATDNPSSSSRHRRTSNSSSLGSDQRLSKDATPYYTVLGSSTGRVVAVGSPADASRWAHDAPYLSGYVWDPLKGEYVKRETGQGKENGAGSSTPSSSLSRTLSKKVSERWKKDKSGLVKRDDSDDHSSKRSRPSIEISRKWHSEKKPGRGSLRISFDKDRSRDPSPLPGGPRDFATLSSTSRNSSTMHTPPSPRVTANTTSGAHQTMIPTPKFNEPRSRKSEPAGLSGGAGSSGGSKIWKLVKRISTGGLKDRYQHQETEEAPPVPALPEHYENSASFSFSKSLDGHASHDGRRAKTVEIPMKEPADARTVFLHSRPSMSADARSRPLPSRPVAVAVPIGVSNATSSSSANGRPSTTTLSSSFSSDKDRFGFLHKSSSASSVSSGWIDAPEGDSGLDDAPRPPLPKSSYYVGKHILPPSELQKMMNSPSPRSTSPILPSSIPSASPITTSTPKQHERRSRSRSKAREILGLGINSISTSPQSEDFPERHDSSFGHSGQKQSLPLPPRRAPRSPSKGSLSGHSSEDPTRPSSPLLPSFSVEGAINSFAPKKHSPSTSKSSPTTSSLRTPFSGPSSSNGSPTSLTAAIPPPVPPRSSSRPSHSQRSSQTSPPPGGANVSFATDPASADHLLKKPGRLRARRLPSPEGGRKSSAPPHTNAPSMVSFRTLPATPDKFPLTEAEKNEKWNDLLERTGGGTIHLGSGPTGLESDSLSSGWVD